MYGGNGIDFKTWAVPRKKIIVKEIKRTKENKETDGLDVLSLYRSVLHAVRSICSLTRAEPVTIKSGAMVEISF